MTYVALGIDDLLLASLLILINGAISVGFRLGLERSLFFATLRMSVQLGAIGFVLKFIFAQTSPLWTLALALVMIAVAGREAVARQESRFKGWWTYGLGTGTLLFVGTVGTVFAAYALIGPDPWYAPRYVIPILGMVLGNTLTGISLGMDTLTASARRERTAIEARIAQGAPRFEALSDILRRALRTGLMPIINAMAASGIVSLPGMMTGQILSGIDPVEAAKYQLMIMFLIAGATGLGVFLAILTSARLLTDDRHRLRLDRLTGG
ncbi:MAG: iron export ABC transporter permease subunit FetB [Pseudomonadota bacterium]|nr:iron export ABC transporter permease subunit FetB [Pseudomonadota bacterium]